MTGAAPPWDGRLRLSAAALLVEQIWPRLWPAAVIIALFLSLAWLDLLPRFSPPLHGAILMVFAVALAAAVALPLRGVRWPGAAEAQRRLEQHAGLRHRPLAALSDEMATGRGDPIAEALWARHRAAAAAATRRLAVRWPSSDMDRREPWGIRAAALMLLIIAATAGYREPLGRLQRAVSPAWPTAGAGRVVDVWITPPAYTGRPPLFLTATPHAPPGPHSIGVPAGSTVLARVSGVHRVPSLLAGDTRIDLEPLDAAKPEGGDGSPAVFLGEARIGSGDRLEVVSGRQTLARWPLTVIADQPPQVRLDGTPEAVGNGSLALRFAAEDDYGVSEAAALVQLAPGGGADGAILRVPLMMEVPGAGRTGGRSLLDLTAHPWAGQPVHVAVEVRDAAGQSGRSAAVPLRLPERSFAHPVARALIAERKRLLTSDPGMAPAVAGRLAEIAADPQQFDGDLVVVLGLSVARARLAVSRAEDAAASVGALLWDLALRLEEGGVPAAEKQVAALREELAQALQRNAPGSEIAALVQRLKQAMDAYLAALAAELQRRQGVESPPLDGEPVMHGEDLQALLDHVGDLARSGAREEASRLLAELQQWMQGVRLGLQQEGPAIESAAAMAAMNALKSLQGDQQRLLDETFARAQERRGQRRPGDSGAAPPEARSRQEALRRALSGIAEQMDDIFGASPPALSDAAQAMQQAADALASGRLGSAVSEQGAAVQALEAALQQARQALAQARGAGIGLWPGGVLPGGDPFGRSGASGRRGFASGTVTIPDRDDSRRAHELLEELRRRAGERGRPEDERQYLERLLRQF
jgi:uncharacterized protein (TIGR02302 family)